MNGLWDLSQAMMMNQLLPRHHSFPTPSYRISLSLQADHGMYICTKEKATNQEAQRARERESSKINPADRAHAWEMEKVPPPSTKKQHGEVVRNKTKQRMVVHKKVYIHPSRTKCQNRLSGKKWLANELSNFGAVGCCASLLPSRGSF